MEHLLDPDANPYLDLWNWVLEVVRGGHGTPFEWYAAWTADATARTNVLLLAALLAILYIRMGGGFGRHRGDVRDRYAPRAGALEQVARPGNTGLLRRLWWSIRPPRDLMRVDGLAIDRTRKPHCAWLGPTGGGKSSAVAVVRCDGRRVYYAVTPDYSDPLIAATERLGGFHWTAGVSTVAINFFPKRRSPNEVAEYLTEVFRSGGVGSWKRKAYLATAEVVRAIDAADEPRSFSLIAQRLKEMCAKDRDLRTVCEGWIGRFESVAEKFGSSADPAGLDLADLIRRGIPVLLDNDAFRHPGLLEDVVALGLAEAKAIADELPDGFRLIFEEAGQLQDRIELAYPFFRAGRRRAIAVDVITQAETDLKYHGSDAITSNIATHVYFAQGQKSLQQLASDRLGFTPDAMRDFTAWITHDGKINRLVTFPKPPKPAKRPTPPTYATRPTPAPYETPHGPTIVIREIGRGAPPQPALPLPPLEVRELLERIDRTQGDCWLWTGAIDKSGYGVVRWAYPDGRPPNNRPAHQVVWEVVNGRWFPTDPKTGKTMEFDHRRSCPRNCVNPAHGEPKSKLANIRAMHRTRGHQTAAD